MAGSSDIGLGAIISLTDGFTGPAGLIAFSLDRLEDKFGLAASVVTHSIKRMATGLGLIGTSFLIQRTFRPHIKNATEFQEAMAEVSTLTENAAGEIQKLSRHILTSSAAMGQMPIETTKLLYQTISAGATNASDRLLVMNQAQMTATAGLADQTEVLDLLASAVKSYGLEWSAVTDISDKAFQTVKLGKTTMGELAVSMQQLFAPAAALGVSMDELFGIMATLTGVTGNTSEVATQLGAVMTSLLKPTSQAEKKAKELGIAWSIQGAQAKGLFGLMEELRLKTNGNVEALGDLIGRKEGIVATLALIGSQSETAAKKINAVATSTGESRIAFEKMSRTMAFAQRQFAAARKSLSTLIGQPLIDAMRPVVKMLTFFTIGIVNFVAQNPLLLKMITTIAYGASIFLAFAGAILTVSGALIFLTALPVVVALGLFSLASAMFAVKVQLWILKFLTPLAMRVIIFSLKLFLKQLLLTFLPLAGLVAALYVLYKVFAEGAGVGKTFRDAFKNISIVWSALTELIDSFDGKFGKMSKSTAGNLRKAGLFELTVKLFMLWARFRALIIGIKEGFVASLNEMANVIRKLLPEGTFLRNIFDKIGKAIASLGLDSNIEEWKNFGQKIGFASGMILLTLSSFKIASFTIIAFTGTIKTLTTAYKALTIAMNFGTSAIGFMISPVGILIGLLAVLAILTWRNRKELKEFWELNKGTDWKQIATEFLGWIFQVDAATTSMEKLKEATKTYLRVLAGITTFGVSELIIRALGKLDELEKKAKMPAPGETVVGLPGAGVAAPKLQKGTPRVKRSGLAFVHKGEAITRSDVAEVLPMRRRIAAPEEAAGMAQPTRETIELIVNLDGDVLARAIAERDRRMGLRQVN